MNAPMDPVMGFQVWARHHAFHSREADRWALYKHLLAEMESRVPSITPGQRDDLTRKLARFAGVRG